MDEHGTKSTWKVLIALAIVCGVVVFAAGFLHRQAVVDAVAKQEARSAAVAKAMTDEVTGVNLTKEAKGADEKALEKSVDPPAGTDAAIFSLDGERVYATAGARIVSGDKAAIADAAKGNVSRVVEGHDLVVYAPIPSEKKGQVAVAAVVTDYQKVLDDGAGPLDAARLPLTALGIVLFVVGLVMLVRERKSGAPQTAPGSKTAKATKEPKAAKPSKDVPAAKSRVSGFDPVPVHSSPEVSATVPVAEPPTGTAAPAPEVGEPVAKRFSLGRKPKTATAAAVAPSTKEAPLKRALFGRKAATAEAAASVAAPGASDDAALEREVAIRQLLENQLEQLRTRLQNQEEQASASIRDLRAQLDAAQADGPAPTGGPAEADMIERLRTLEAELAQARQAAAEATAQAASMQQELAAASTAGVSADAAGMESQLRALQEQLEEAQRTATESEQRAQSIESVRGELEVRVAQLGSKAGELEHKAEQLETRLREANEGGNAVRAEIATLTASLAAAEARVAELETVSSSKGEDGEEIARLRSELGKHMERAQVAEERVATLEADVLAAEHGVEELSDTPAETLAPHDEPSSGEPAAEGSAPITEGSAPITEGSAPVPHEAPVEPAAVRSEAESEGEVRVENPPAPSGADRYDDVWSAAFPVQQNGSQEASASEATPEQDAAPTAEPESTVEATTAEPESETGSEEQPVASQDEASEPEDNMSVEDDLWALRARLAHAGETEQERQTPPAPSWS